MASGRERAEGWGQQNLAELQPCCVGVPAWLERGLDVRADLGSKDQQGMGLIDFLFFFIEARSSNHS